MDWAATQSVHPFTAPNTMFGLVRSASAGTSLGGKVLLVYCKKRQRSPPRVLLMTRPRLVLVRTRPPALRRPPILHLKPPQHHRHRRRAFHEALFTPLRPLYAILWMRSRRATGGERCARGPSTTHRLPRELSRTTTTTIPSPRPRRPLPIVRDIPRGGHRCSASLVAPRADHRHQRDHDARRQRRPPPRPRSRS